MSWLGFCATTEMGILFEWFFGREFSGNRCQGEQEMAGEENRRECGFSLNPWKSSSLAAEATPPWCEEASFLQPVWVGCWSSGSEGGGEDSAPGEAPPIQPRATFLWKLSSFTFTFHLHEVEKEMAAHSSVPAWRVPGTGEPGGLPSMGSHSQTQLKQLSSSSSYYLSYFYRIIKAQVRYGWNGAVFLTLLLCSTSEKLSLLN